MARTTESQVAEIIELDSTISVTAFITTANEIVTECCSTASYSASRLELIERWLTAHFYAIRVGEVETEKAGPVSEKKFGKVDLLFHQTRYGQQALLLDTAGGLAALNERMKTGKKKKASFTYLGTEPTDETRYL